MPDHFDRLLAPPSRAALRPRLPGPFERIDALRTDPQEEAELLVPRTVAPAPPPPTERLRLEREVRTTDRITFVHTEQLPPESPQPARPIRTPEPQAPAPPPADRIVVTAEQEPRQPQQIEPAQPAPRPSAPGVLRVAAAPVPSEQPRTRLASAAARVTARTARQPAPQRAEPTVQVEIGRLEVNAARPQQRTRPQSPQRQAPAVTLTDYLSERAKS